MIIDIHSLHLALDRFSDLALGERVRKAAVRAAVEEAESWALGNDPGDVANAAAEAVESAFGVFDVRDIAAALGEALCGDAQP